MAILMDYSQVILSNLFTSIGNHYNIEVDESLIRHMFLNTLRSNKMKFQKQFGELIVCVDDTQNWRRESFPYYKARRREGRQKSEIDWKELFRIINLIREELDEFFPYKVIKISQCEADDVIGTIIHYKGEENPLLAQNSEQFLILSGDKDYIQLHVYENVEQYDPVQKKWIRHSDPHDYLLEQIIRGDGGDDVPNVLSADDTFVQKKRQVVLTKKRLGELKAGTFKGTDVYWQRNKTMINLSNTPENLKKEIIQEYNRDKKISRKTLREFFMDRKLKALFDHIGDF